MSRAIPVTAPPVVPVRDELIRRGLRLPQLRLLVAVKETGKVSSAAAQVAMTQSAASRLLADLEKTVDARLYDRHARGVTLTAAGETLALKARDLLNGLDDVQHQITALSKGERGTVRIGSVTGPAVELVLPVIRELRVTYPDIELSVHVDTSDKLADALTAGELDFYIGRVPEGMDTRAIMLTEVGPEPVSLVARLEHPLSRKTDLKVADCLSYDWVMQPENGLLRRTAEAYLLSNGLNPPERILSTSSMLLTLAIICETNAIAPLAGAAADFYAGERAFGGRIRRLNTAPDLAVVPFSLIQLRSVEATPAVKRVLRLIRQKIAGMAKTPSVPD
ncbi:LysR family transcriptional regulator [Heliomarina baculiformis]|uniref:LysR family transcriptional regulator n=1 Tax=Heliomarina baculiformis TaxID=2872036 RepID=UPI001EE27CC2|nr:LysR family transcriptional regulator [Heliomarina baculiformis]